MGIILDFPTDDFRAPVATKWREWAAVEIAELRRRRAVSRINELAAADAITASQSSDQVPEPPFAQPVSALPTQEKGTRGPRNSILRTLTDSPGYLTVGSEPSVVYQRHWWRGWRAVPTTNERMKALKVGR